VWSQASDVSLLDAFAGNKNIRALPGETPNLEGIGFNEAKPPLDDPKVREAIMYAVDRQAIVDTIVKRNDPQASVMNCGFLALPSIGPWCHGAAGTPFSGFRYDPAKTAQILEQDGYTRGPGPNRYFQKNGKELTIPWSVISGNRRRELTENLEIERARTAGIHVIVANAPTDQFWENVQGGDFGIAEAGFGVPPDPSIEATFGCDQFPTKANGFTGGNAAHWCDWTATTLMRRADHTLNQGARLKLMQQIYELEAKDFVALPFYSVPFVGAWRTDRLAGPIGRWNSTWYGFFWNMDQWYCVRPGACS